MTFTDTIMFELEGDVYNLSNGRFGKITNMKIWKSLRTHILSDREKRKQAESDAEVLRKKVYLKNQKIQENKLSLAQINGRLSELRDKKDLREEEKRALLEQKQNTDHTALKKLEINKSGTTYNINGAGSTMPFSQHRQNIIDMFATRSDILSGETLTNKTLPVVIPTKINGSKQNYWIIHHPV